jgi:hypothetical protein
MQQQYRRSTFSQVNVKLLAVVGTYCFVLHGQGACNSSMFQREFKFEVQL